MYCGACTRDLHLVRGLIARGVDVQVIPLYTPLRNEVGDTLPLSPVHLGGINAYLQQMSPRFAALPAALHQWLDRPGLLTWAGQFAVKTDPRQLGAMTVSVLEGQDGRQRSEIARLLRFLREEIRPDMVCLTNSLLSGVAPAVKAELGLPVLCSLQGEDQFLGALPEPHRARAQARVRANAGAIDLFVAPGAHYAAEMADWLAVPPARIRLVYAGIDGDAFLRERPRAHSPFIVGYLSVINRAKGLHLLVEGFARFQRQTQADAQLHIAGRVLDAGYWRAIHHTIRAEGLTDRVTIAGEVDFDGKREFLQQCSVLVMPSRLPETRAMVALEAQAAGLPVIAPEIGIFPELFEQTRGGLLVPPEDPAALAAALTQLYANPATADLLGRNGATGIAAHFTVARMAEQMHAAITELLAPSEILSS